MVRIVRTHVFGAKSAKQYFVWCALVFWVVLKTCSFKALNAYLELGVPVLFANRQPEQSKRLTKRAGSVTVNSRIAEVKAVLSPVIVVECCDVVTCLGEVWQVSNRLMWLETILIIYPPRLNLFGSESTELYLVRRVGKLWVILKALPLKVLYGQAVLSVLVIDGIPKDRQTTVLVPVVPENITKRVSGFLVVVARLICKCRRGERGKTECNHGEDHHKLHVSNLTHKCLLSKAKSNSPVTGSA